jgi:Ni/Co efflux regulator RcnB
MHPFRFPTGATGPAMVCGLLVLFLATQAAWADPPADKGKPARKSSMPQMHMYDSMHVGVSAGITVGDARELAQRYEMIGQKPLPPGIRKNLARGKPLPPGIEKTRMPEAFVQALPRHEGYEWRQAGGDLVLVASGTLVISDILEGVFD